jgi:phosphoribosylamine--glycine ligase
MHVLVVGSGGREHALAWKIAQSHSVSKVWAAPGNAGIGEVAECVDIGASDIGRLADFAERERIDLTVVGPEGPLTFGIVDEFEQRGLRIFGPSKRAAIMEGSKAFAKNLMKKYHIPTGFYRVCAQPDEARQFIREVGAPIVVKADGLAAGKGAIVCTDVAGALDAVQQIMVDRVFGDAGDQVVVEEYLEGEEASFLAFTDGDTVLPMASSQDHKRVLDDDQGPNTGGMGAYSPAPVITDPLHDQVMERVMIPAIKGMAAEGRPYKGILYAGLMIRDGEAKVLEFNARFGDPEAQPLLVRMKSDLVPLLEAAAEGRLRGHAIEWAPDASVCVVMASGGYPGTYEKGFPISGLREAAGEPGVVIFHAGTNRSNDHIVTAGGRVLGVTALGRDIREAIDRAYRAVKKIRWQGAHYRTDIGRRALARIGHAG